MNMHVLYQRHAVALGVSEYNAFCKLWPKVCALLDAPAQIESAVCNCNRKRCKTDLLPTYGTVNPKTLAECLRAAIDDDGFNYGRRRVVLLDGTVVREWSIDEYDGIF